MKDIQKHFLLVPCSSVDISRYTTSLIKLKQIRRVKFEIRIIIFSKGKSRVEYFLCCAERKRVRLRKKEMETPFFSWGNRIIKKWVSLNERRQMH